MDTSRTLQAVAICAALFAATSASSVSYASSASAASAAAAAGPVPRVVIVAKRPTMQEKLRMTLEDVAQAAKRLAGVPQKNSKPAANLG